MIIDAENSIIGRVATAVAKKALMGEEVHVVNCEKAIISGDAQKIAEKIRERRRLGQPNQGPYIQTQPFRYVRRVIRGMLPYSKPRGREAFSRVKCYESVPDMFKEEKLEKIKNTGHEKLPTTKYITIAKLCNDIRER